MNIQCFDSIKISEPDIHGKSVNTEISCTPTEGKKEDFSLWFKYDTDQTKKNHSLFRMASVMPLINYGLFTKEIKLNFEISEADFSLIKDLIKIFAKDIFVNKLVRKKNPYILSQFSLNKNNIPKWKTIPKVKITPKKIIKNTQISNCLNKKSCGILSSGGKESLLTYGILKEIGAEVHPIYVNESGGHWRTALPAYKQFKHHDLNTKKVWTNVDRLYTFMLDHMKIIKKNHRKIWADTYPIRLCIFPVYVFSVLPIFVNNKIGNVLIGSEFDDPRTSLYFAGIKHFFGIFDQTQEFDLKMEKWFSKRLPIMRQWSAVRSISGLIVERILTSRYPKLAIVQRSCHSCRFEQSNILPCGKCSKCQGVLLFLLANNVDPSIMGYRKDDIMNLPTRIAKGNLRLDEDEKKYTLFLAKYLTKLNNRYLIHVETIHVDKQTSDLKLIPTHFRDQILKILQKYTKGFSILNDKTWIPLQTHV